MQPPLPPTYRAAPEFCIQNSDDKAEHASAEAYSPHKNRQQLQRLQCGRHFLSLREHLVKRANVCR